MKVGSVVYILFLVKNAFSLCGSGQGCFELDELRGTCEFTGYIPGGKRVMLDPIESPSASNQGNALSQYAYYAGYENQVVGSAADIVALTKKFGKFAQKFSGALGIWGSVVGGVLFKEPTTQDVINAMNSAFDKLTQEINDQFYNMEEYVKQSILDLEKQLMTDTYKKYRSLLNLCLDRLDLDSLIDCLRNVHDESLADQDSFMRFKTQMERNTWGSWHPGNVVKTGNELRLDGTFENRQSCFMACLKKLQDGYNGVKFGRLGQDNEKECYCQLGMTEIGGADPLIWEAAFISGRGSFIPGNGQAPIYEKLDGVYEDQQACFRGCMEKKISNSSYNSAAFGSIGGSNAKQCWCKKFTAYVLKPEGNFESAFLANFEQSGIDSFSPGNSVTDDIQEPQEGRFETSLACFQHCMGKKRYDSSYNGATYGIPTEWRAHECWCIKGMTGYYDDPVVESAYLTSYGDWMPDVDDVKHMEAQFLTFRNYAQLRMLILMSMAATFENTTEAELPNTRKYSKMYLERLREESDLYIRYANFIYDHILHMHLSTTEWWESQMYCETTVKTDGPDWEGRDCMSQFSPMLIKTDQCKQVVWLFTKVWGFTDLCPCENYSYREKFNLTPLTNNINDVNMHESLTNFAKHRMRDSNTENYYKFREESTRSVVNFWSAEVISQLPVWKDILKGALTKLEKLKDIDLMNPNKMEINDQSQNGKTEL